MRSLVFLFFFVTTWVNAQHKATREDGRKVLLHDNHTWSFADSSISKPTLQPPAKPGNRLEIPALGKGEEILSHSAYSFVYAEKYEQAKWVAYHLTASETQKQFERTNRFGPDPLVATGTATDADYKASGYDRGHLAPASDMGWSETAMKESFYYSNMSPQSPSFNRGIWKKGEDLVRQWANAYGSLYVVTGPVLKPGLPTIGPNQVAVPELFYKVVLDYQSKEKKALAFLIPNEGSKESLQRFVVSVDSVEKTTGIDFFPSLPDDEEKQLEKHLCIGCWQWTGQGTVRNPAFPDRGGLHLCKGTNQDGSPCANHIPKARSYCSNHTK